MSSSQRKKRPRTLPVVSGFSVLAGKPLRVRALARPLLALGTLTPEAMQMHTCITRGPLPVCMVVRLVYSSVLPSYTRRRRIMLAILVLMILAFRGRIISLSIISCRETLGFGLSRRLLSHSTRGRVNLR